MAKENVMVDGQTEQEKVPIVKIEDVDERE